MYVVDDGIVQIAATTINFREQFSYEQRHILSFQPEFIQHSGIYEVYARRPRLLTIVCTSLMEQNTFYDTYLLCLFSQFHQSAERLVVIILAETFEPVSTCSNHAVRLILVIKVYAGTANGNIDDSYSDGIGQLLHHSTSEIVCWRQSCPCTTQWWNSNIPVTHLPAAVRHIDTSHHQEAWRYPHEVLFLYFCITLHIRLSETEVYMKVRIKLRGLLSQFTRNISAVIEI